MGQVEGPTVPLQSDAPEESDLWTAWQLFPLDDDQTCHSKDWVGQWVGVELLSNSVKTRSQTVELETICGRESHARPKGLSEPPDWVGVQRRCWQDVVGKATPGQRATRGPWRSFGDQLVISCSRESHNPAESRAPGPPVEQRWRRGKTQRWRP